MLRIEITTFASEPPASVAALEAEYMKRLKPLAAVKLQDLKLERREAALKSPESGQVCTILLDETGETLTSEGFAKLIEKQTVAGRSTIRFLIGPADGWTKDELSRAKIVLSLSRLTFTAHFARMLLLEQLYRAFSILRGTAYHRR